MTVTRFALTIAGALVVAACSDNAAPTTEPLPASPARISERSMADDDGRKYWRNLSDSALWASMSRTSVAVIGMRAPGTERGVANGRVVISRSVQAQAAQSILGLPGIRKVDADTLLPILRVNISDIDALRRLRRLPQVDYVEPDIFRIAKAFFQTTCGGDPYAEATTTHLGD